MESDDEIRERVGCPVCGVAAGEFCMASWGKPCSLLHGLRREAGSERPSEPSVERWHDDSAVAALGGRLLDHAMRASHSDQDDAACDLSEAAATLVQQAAEIVRLESIITELRAVPDDVRQQVGYSCSGVMACAEVARRMGTIS